jgi:hypothetical protein
MNVRSEFGKWRSIEALEREKEKVRKRRLLYEQLAVAPEMVLYYFVVQMVPISSTEQRK